MIYDWQCVLVVGDNPFAHRFLKNILQIIRHLGIFFSPSLPLSQFPFNGGQPHYRQSSLGLGSNSAGRKLPVEHSRPAQRALPLCRPSRVAIHPSCPCFGGIRRQGSRGPIGTERSSPEFGAKLIKRKMENDSLKGKGVLSVVEVPFGQMYTSLKVRINGLITNYTQKSLCFILQ